MFFSPLARLFQTDNRFVEEEFSPGTFYITILLRKKMRMSNRKMEALTHSEMRPQSEILNSKWHFIEQKLPKVGNFAIAEMGSKSLRLVWVFLALCLLVQAYPFTVNETDLPPYLRGIQWYNVQDELK